MDRKAVIECMARGLCRADGPDPNEPNWEDVYWDAYTCGAAEALTALEAAGFQVVPVDPTQEMGLAGAAEVDKQMLGPGAPADYHAAVDAYRAMLAAAKE